VAPQCRRAHCGRRGISVTISMAITVAATVAALIAAIGPVFGIPALRRAGFIDVASPRSSHTGVAIRGVGAITTLALLFGLGAGLMVYRAGDTLHWVGILAVTTTMLAFVGLGDDYRGLRVRVRLAAQLLIGLVGGLGIALVSGVPPLPLMLLTAAGVFVGTNVVNFMDGVDGMSGLHGILFGAGFILLGAMSALPWLAITGAALAAASAGFLGWNLNRQGTFGGDVGSYMLGGAVSVAAIAAGINGVPIVLLLALLVVYFIDTFVTVVRRIVSGQEWHRPHRSFYYQKLAIAGWSHVAVSATTAGFSSLAFVVALGFTLVLNSPVLATFAVVGVGMTYLASTTFFIRVGPEISPLAPPESPLPSRAANAPWARWAVVGASGFIGGQVSTDLRDRGLQVRDVIAPRVLTSRRERPSELVTVARGHEAVIAALAIEFAGVETVVNAAGLATPTADESDSLTGANALLPVIIVLAAARANVSRVVHLSSAASQGRRRILDESAETEPFSPYSLSKADGELTLLELCRQMGSSAPEVVIVRATSVHGAGTEKIRALRRMAASPRASVAGTGGDTTVLSSLDDFVRFVHWVGSWPANLPTILLQPDEGLRSADILRLAGGREPRHLPRWICHLVIGVAYGTAAAAPALRARVRRTELMWFGQRLAPTWASTQGWLPSDALPRMLSGAEPFESSLSS